MSFFKKAASLRVILSYRYNYILPDLPITHSSPFSGLAYSSFLSPPLKLRCLCQSIVMFFPLLLFVHCIVTIKQFGEFPYLIFNACLRLRFLDVETSPGPRRPVPAISRILCSNVRGLAESLSVWHTRYDILLAVLCYFGLRYASRVGVAVFPDLVALSCCAGEVFLGGPRDGGIRTRWIWSILPTQFECRSCEMLVLGGFGVRHNFYVFSLYLDLNDQIVDCLLTTIWLPCRMRTCGHLCCLWVIWMPIIRSGWVLRPRIVMVLQLFTSQLCLVVYTMSGKRPKKTWKKNI